MNNGIPLINILTYGLPGTVTRPLYLEYNSRRKELDRIWAKGNNRYQILQGHVTTVEALLAISLFRRHVMGFIQGATSFYKLVNQQSLERECAISIGNSILDKKQQNYLLASVILLMSGTLSKSTKRIKDSFERRYYINIMDNLFEDDEVKVLLTSDQLSKVATLCRKREK